MMNHQTVLAAIKQVIVSHVSPMYRLYVFGSVASGKNRKYSDIDIGIEGDDPVPLEIIGAVKEALEESSLPYTVDIVDLNRVPDTFRKHALKHARPL